MISELIATMSSWKVAPHRTRVAARTPFSRSDPFAHSTTMILPSNLTTPFTHWNSEAARARRTTLSDPWASGESAQEVMATVKVFRLQSHTFHKLAPLASQQPQKGKSDPPGSASASTTNSVQVVYDSSEVPA